MREKSQFKALPALGVASLALVVSALVSGPPAFSGGEVLPNVDKTYIDESGVIHYTFDPESMPGATLSRETTDLLSDGSCDLTASGGASGKAGDPTITVGSEISFDPDTCERLMATASYPLDRAPQSVLDTLTPTDGTRVDSEHLSGGFHPNATWFGKLKAYIEDPIQIDVSSTTSEHTWNSSGGESHNHRWGWYTPSGWSRTDYSAINGSYYTDTTGWFTNLVFCNPFLDTQTFHRQTIFRGYTNGTWSWDYSMNKGGGDGDCSYLLNYRYTAVTP